MQHSIHYKAGDVYKALLCGVLFSVTASVFVEKALSLGSPARWHTMVHSNALQRRIKVGKELPASLLNSDASGQSGTCLPASAAQSVRELHTSHFKEHASLLSAPFFIFPAAVF